jgi:predicted amidohydrolase YtcJ
VARRSWKGTLIAPHEALTREEHEKGRLAPGWLADLAVLDRDYLAVPEEEIKDLRVNLTVIDDKVAYRRNGAW